VPATSRRQRGSGSKGKDGRWAFRSRGRVFYGWTLTEAKQKAALESGRLVLASSGTLTSYLEDWLASIKSEKAPQTWTGYANKMRLHVEPYIGDVMLAAVTERDIDRLQSILAHGPLSGTTRRGVHVILGTALEAARRRGLIAVNPVRNVRAPKSTVKEATPLTVEQARSLLAAARGTKYESFFVLTLTTGIRPGEAMGLHWRDLDGSRLSIRGNAVTGHGGVRHVGPTKTERSRRTVTLTTLAVDAMALYRSQQASTAPGDLIYPAADGGVLEASLLSRQYFAPLVRAAGLPESTRLYDLRHTAATNLLNAGTPVHVVSGILGHSNPTVTWNTYSHFVSGGDSAAAATVQSLYG
jgi:integrase